MSEPFVRLRRFLRELKRRKVYRVAAGYLVSAFVVLQLAGLAADAFGFPGWFQPMIWVVAGLGFPLAIVLAWAFEVTPEGVRRTPEGEPEDSVEEELPQAQTGTRTSYKLLIGLGLIAAALAGGWYLTGGGESPKVTESTVAVMPFQVSGSGAEEWRDGMVTMLTTGLDGAGGLRAIPDRTVFATWEDRGQSGEGASSEQAISIVREMGARYAVVGSAVALSDELRLSANVRSTESGERLGQAEVRGSPDSVTALADSLTRRVLGVLLEKSGESLPSVDLASVTTQSLPALKSFLAGERHYRAGEYGEAVSDYESAIDEDSTFALAYHRLESALVWSGTLTGVPEARDRALNLSDRLPLRERRIVRAKYLWNGENHVLAARDSLRRLTQSYPDDAWVWHWLGEALYHGAVPGALREAEEAFERAIDLDPGLRPSHHHYVELAFILHRDSTLAAERIAEHPIGDHQRMYQLALKLVFGDTADRSKLISAVDTIPDPTLSQLENTLHHPVDGALWMEVLRRLQKRAEFDRRFSRTIATVSLQRGQIQQALVHLQENELGAPSEACTLAQSVTLGIPLPDSLLRARLDPSRIETGAGPRQLLCSGLYFLTRNRRSEVPALLRRLHDASTGQGDSEAEVQRLVNELKGYRAWKDGNLNQAAQLWSDANETERWGAIWRGDLYQRLGQTERAAEWYRAAWRHPVTHERLGQLYEEMGEPEKAAEAYRRFIEAWEDADPELQPRVEAARQRLQELTTSESETNE